MINLSNEFESHNKLPIKTKIGYGAATLSDGLAYVFFYSFFMLFLTDYAMINPAWAGTLSLLVVLWDAVTDPIMGWLSDNCTSKMGRRRPFFIIGIIPWMISLVLMFTIVDFGPVAQYAYYLFMAMLFWTGYTICIIPFNALGAEITQDYSERATVRLYAQFFSSGGVAIASVCTMALLGLFAGMLNVEDKYAWTFVAVVYAIISLIGFLVTFFSTKGWDKPLSERKDVVESNVGFFKTVIQILKEVKPVRWLLIAIVAFMCGNSLYGAGIYYAYVHLLEWSASQIALAGTFTTVFGLVGPVILNIFVKKIDKKRILVICLAVTSISCFAFRFIGINSTLDMYIYLTFYAFANIGFWGLFWSLAYDTCEVDELLYSKRREGATTSIASLTSKLGSSIALWLLGIILSLSGYDATVEVQSTEALTGILNVLTLYTGLFTLLSLILFIIYPLNKKTFLLVQKALEDKKNTGTYSKEGLERVI